jgi:23S rRNA pseudouridine1911/1915/1917 synthase
LPAYSGYVAGEIPSRLRLDRYAALYLKLLSRSQIRAKNLKAKVNGKEVKISRLLKAGDFLELFWNDSEPPDLIPEDLPLDIIYEDGRVAVINKAQGMVVHPGAGNYRGTLANALLWRRQSRGGAGEGFRPGIVHRLDKDTSGVIIAAYDDEALAFLSSQFKERKVRKVYAAIVRGGPAENRGQVETRITRDKRDRKKFTVSETTGKPAVTGYRVIRRWEGYSLLLLRPYTGRTHQIRVHLLHLGCPILGDPLYNGEKDKKFKNATLMLHAKSLSIQLPFSGENTLPAPRRFSVPLPERFREIIRLLGRR